MNPRDQGRSLLQQWEAARPTNFYDDDVYLRFSLGRRLGAVRLAAVEPDLRRAGADAAGPISRACVELDRPEHLPRIEAWSRIGEHRADIAVHPLHHETGRLVWRSGVLAVLAEAGHVTEHVAFYYLFGLNGEVPHLCSLACSAGLVKAIQRAGSDWMRSHWLPRLLDRDYERRWHGAQFLTEVQGGSDVGANACVARPAPDAPGQWLIDGEKWFCSNVGADLYAVSARPEGAPDGTRGIGLFVVPRCLGDGRPNGVRIRRLKNKLGTRTLPTAELDFEGARAWELGRPDEGFKLLMGVVINTSRLAVAVGSCGMMRRAWIEAIHYARARQAFGQRLIDFPAVRQQLAEMRVLADGGLALALLVASLEDGLTAAGVPPEEDALFRTSVNVAKYICSTDAGTVVHHAIEILGGNGTIEDLTPLPRLYREVPVQESWEGPHNTLMAQLHRDALRSKMHAALLGYAQERLLAIKVPALVGSRDQALAALDDVRGSLDGLLRGEAREAGFHMRGLIGRMARITQAALLLEDAQAAAAPMASRLGASAQFLLDRWVTTGYEAMRDPAYAARIAGIIEG